MVGFGMGGSLMVTVYVFGLDETCRSQVITFRPVRKDQLKFIHICTWYNVCASARVRVGGGGVRALWYCHCGTVT